MNQDAGKINLVFAADTEDVERGTERVENLLNQTGDSAEVAGKRIDNAFKQESMSVRELNDVIEVQSKVVSDLRNAYERAKQAASDAFGGDAAKYNELVEAQEKLKKEYDEESEALKRLNAQRDAMNTSGDAEENLRTKLRQTTQEIASLTIRYREMSDTEKSSAKGQELKKKLEELIKKAGNLRDAMDDANRAIRSTASDTQNFDALAGGLNVITSTAGAAQGALSMLGVNQEALMDIQTKLQASLAISNALSVIQNNLQKESAVMLGVRRMQEHAASIAIAIRTAAEGKGVIVTKAATVAQAAFNAVAKANPYVLLATVLIGVVSALVGFTKKTKEATEAEKKQREELEKQRKAAEEWKKSISDSAAQVASQYRLLQEQYRNLKNEHEKKKWIDENKSAFSKLGVAVNSVTDAEKVFIQNTAKMMDAFKKRAEAAAYQTKLTEAYSRLISRREQLEEERTRLGQGANVRQAGQKVEGEDASRYGLQEGVDYTRKSGQVGMFYTEAGAAKVNRGMQERRKEENDPEIKRINDEINGYVEKIKELQRGIEADLDGLTASVTNNVDKDKKALADALARAKQAYEKALEEANKAKEEAEVKATEDDEERAIKQLALSHQRKLEEIDREEKELLAKKKAAEGEEATLTDAELKIFSDRRDAENAIYNQALAERSKAAADREKEDMMQYLIEYGDYQEAVSAIHERYVNLRAKAETDGKRSSLAQQEIEEVEALGKKFDDIKLDKLKSSADYIRAMGNLAAYTSKELDNMKQHLEKMISVGGNAMSAQELNAYREALERIEKQQEKLKHPFGKTWVTELKEITRLEKDIEEEKKRQKKLEDELIAKKKELFELQQRLVELQKQGSGASQQDINDTVQQISQVKDQISNLNGQLGDSMGKVGSMAGQMKAVGGGAASTLAIVDTIIRGVYQSIQATIALFYDIKELAESFGANTDSATWEDATIVMEALGKMNEHAMQGWEDLKSGNVAGAVQHTVGVITSIIKGINALIDAKHERRIKELQEDIIALQRAYDDLERAVSHTYSFIKQGNIEAEIGSKQQQINLIQQQIQEERDKKDTDDERIQEWQDKIHDLEQEIIDLREYAVDAIFGENINNAIENFASAYADAWTSGEDRAKSAKDTVKNMMKQMVTESIKSALQASGAMEQIRQRLQEFYVDNVLTPWEQERIMNMAENLQRQLDAQFGWADSLFAPDEKKTQDSTRGGFDTMTQDQASELSGRFTGIQMETAMIDQKLDTMIESNTAIRASSASIAEGMSQMVELHGLAVSHLAQIEKNTNELPEINERLEKIEKNTRSL